MRTNVIQAVESSSRNFLRLFMPGRRRVKLVAVKFQSGPQLVGFLYKLRSEMPGVRYQLADATTIILPRPAERWTRECVRQLRLVVVFSTV